MVDHPLVSTEMRQYIQKNKIEELLNTGLNLVLTDLPQDPFSTMARTLIEVSNRYQNKLQSQNKPPIIDRIEAFETQISGGVTSISIDVYVNYQNRVVLSNSYVFPFNPEEAENAEFF